MNLIKPAELEAEAPHGPWSCRGNEVWEMISAASAGDVAEIRRLLAKDPNLYRCEYWYTQPIHFAAREGHVEAIQALLEAGADPTVRAHGREDLVTVARDRGHEAAARLLEETRGARVTPVDHPIHEAAAAGDIDQVRAMLDGKPELVRLRDREGRTALHRVVPKGRLDVVGLLLDRGAEVDAVQALGDVYAASAFRPIDLALFKGKQGNVEMARFLLSRGAEHSITVAAALGDEGRVRELLDRDPSQIQSAQPCGRRPLSAAVQYGHYAIARLLLERGTDPNWPEGRDAPKGTALYTAARLGDELMVELLLARGADPNSTIESSGSATFIASTPKIRQTLIEEGGKLDAFDLVWMDEDAKVIELAEKDPRWVATTGCGGALAAAVKQGKRELLEALLARGVRVPQVATTCRTYLWTHVDMARRLLEHGMDPNLPNWQRVTPLHDLCSRDGRGRPDENRLELAALFLEFGADIDAKDEEYRSTPLGWAARNDLPEMVEFLLARGAKMNLPDDEPWATPLAWARKRGNDGIVAMLVLAGAKH